MFENESNNDSIDDDYYAFLNLSKEVFIYLYVFDFY